MEYFNMSNGNGILQADLEFGLHIYFINFLFQDHFLAWPTLFHVSNADVSHNVRVNVTCNIGRGNNCMLITCPSKRCIQCPYRRLGCGLGCTLERLQYQRYVFWPCVPMLPMETLGTLLVMCLVACTMALP
jgi:hypothetical protein